jgi:uncharacterized protein (DUF433 family)
VLIAWVVPGCFAVRACPSALFENREDGVSAGQSVAFFPGVALERVRTALEHVARSALAPA